MIKTIRGFKAWVTRNKQVMMDNYCWANINKILSDEEMESLKKYIDDMYNIRFYFIINGVDTLRPQRTFGCFLPKWLRSDSSYKLFGYNNNAFVFVNCLKEDCREEWEELKKFVENIGTDIPECKIFIKEFL